jgi:glucan phosphoethanolaminetransferase (alkaline phosphatase superfamily)
MIKTRPEVVLAPPPWHLPVYLKLAIVVGLLIITNLTFFQGLPFQKLFRLLGLVSAEPAIVGANIPAISGQGGQLTDLIYKLLPLIPIWIATLAGVAYAAVDKRLWLRVATGALVAASAGFTALYERVAGAPLSMLDIMAMWSARHEAGRAIQEYQAAVVIGLITLLATFTIIVWPSRQSRLSSGRLWRKLWLIPVLPVAVHASVYYNNSGFYPFALPGQYNSAALGTLLTYQLATEEAPKRLPVSWLPTAGQRSKHIIVMVDESIRADFIDLRPGNPHTPELAKLADQFLNFGPAASGGVCSNYSNALIRFGASRKNIAVTAKTNPTIFAYAKMAGYRTVYIDAQAYHIAVGHKIQNFMTVQETAEIDKFYTIKTSDLPQADYELTKVIAQELQSDEPVFVYANKNGAHFPYNATYPPNEEKFQAAESDPSDGLETRIASYRNAIAWSVDKWMADFFKSVDMSQATMIYTGDHGQRFKPGQLTHCQSSKIDPVTAYVPLFVFAPPGSLREELVRAIPMSRSRATHFMIAPTVYELMGYSRDDVRKAYDESLFIGSQREAQFTSGDIFGLFGSDVTLNSIDLSQRFLVSQTE